MSKVDKKQLLAVAETRFDAYSAQVVLDEALEKAGFSGRQDLDGPELITLAGVLASIRTRMEWVAYEVARLGSGGAVVQPAVEVPKVEAKIEPKIEPKPELKVEVKPEPKPEPKPEAKVEAKIETKVEAKPEPAGEHNGQHKGERRGEHKGERKGERRK